MFKKSTADAGGTARRPNPPAVFCTIMPPAIIEYLTITRTPHAAAVVPPGCAAGSAALVCRSLKGLITHADCKRLVTAGYRAEWLRSKYLVDAWRTRNVSVVCSDQINADVHAQSTCVLGLGLEFCGQRGGSSGGAGGHRLTGVHRSLPAPAPLYSRAGPFDYTRKILPIPRRRRCRPAARKIQGRGLRAVNETFETVICFEIFNIVGRSVVCRVLASMAN
ncbi:hypothetical protein B5X24_HaOG207449 [Helicoverpa armigera]|nr:hypothetical protein B5X24_HaOG207449 [Helicoverpa armigera]